MTDKPKDTQNKNDCKVKKSCSHEMMKQRQGLIYTADDIPKPPTNPNTGKPYFKVGEMAWNGEWVAGEVKPILNSEFGGDDE